MSENHEQENLTQEIQENEMPNDEHHNPDNQVKDDDSSKKITSGHEIISEEDNKKYFLEFVKKNSLIKIILSERDIFPYKTYELLTSLEELQPKNNYLLNFNSPEELVSELNNPNTTINFTLGKKQANIIELFFIFPIEGEEEDNTLEIELTADQINDRNDREMFRQLFEKYKSIKQEQDDDIAQLKNRMNAIEEILNNMQKEQEMQRERDRLEKERLEKEKEMENEEHNEEEQNENQELENVENIKNKEISKNKKGQLNEIKASNKSSKKSFQKGKEKNILKGKNEKNKQEKINNKKKIK